MVKIKICGLTDLTNTGEIVKTSPDFVGFNFYPRSKRYVGTNPGNPLFSLVPCSILKTGVFVNEDPRKITATVKKYNLDLVQLHGNESVKYCKHLTDKGLLIIKAFGINESFSFSRLKDYMEVCEYFLFDSKTGQGAGSGLKFNWDKIDEYDLDKPFFLAGGIGPEDVTLIKQLNHISLFAVDINSCFEVSPGIKDVKKTKEFIDEIKG